MDAIVEVAKHYAIEITAVVIIVALTLLWKVVAKILTAIFSKISVAGAWETKLDSGGGLTKHEEAKLRQFIHRVWGTTTTAAGVKHRVDGVITGDRLCMDYHVTGGGADCGAILLQIMADGRNMKGYEVGTDPTTNALYSRPYEWTRKP